MITAYVQPTKSEKKNVFYLENILILYTLKIKKIIMELNNLKTAICIIQNKYSFQKSFFAVCIIAPKLPITVSKLE